MADPAEKADLAEAEPAVVSELAAELEDWRRSAAADARAHLAERASRSRLAPALHLTAGSRFRPNAANDPPA